MKTHQTKVCGQEAPTGAQLNRCLPFCGLGATEALTNKAARCGAVHLEQNTLRDREPARAKA